jgi:hypothetical protein
MFIIRPNFKIKLKNLMWFSIETASKIHDWANVVLIGALAVGVVSTLLVVWMGNIKEGYLRRDIYSAGVESAKAIENAAKANERAAEAELAAAEANKKAEEERLARVKIEEKLAPRYISKDQFNTIVSQMSKWAELPDTTIKQDAAVFSIISNFESVSLADQLATALKTAGWNINRNLVTFGKSYSISGIGILTSSNPRGVAVSEALSNALNSEGILTFIISDKRNGCEEMDMEPSKINSNPFCSQISIMIGDHP